MKQRMKYIAIFLFFTGFTFAVQAQDRPDLNRELNLEKEYNPSLRDANKINRLPEIKDPEVPKTPVSFSNYTLNYHPAPYLSLLNPPIYLSDFATSKKRGYLVGGVSSLLDLNGDLGYQLLNSDKDKLSVFASHRSSNSSVEYLQSVEPMPDVKMKINDNLGGFNYVHRFEKTDLSADAQYTHSAFNDYGLLYNLYGQKVDQVNNLLQAHLGVASANNKDFIYQVNAAYTLFKLKYNQSFSSNASNDILEKTEHRLLLDGNLFAQFNSIGGIGIKGSIKNYRYNLPSHLREEYAIDLFQNQDYTTLSATPYFTFGGDSWDTHLGVSANVRAGGISDFMVAPDVRFQWYPTEMFRLYLKAEGGIRDNSHYTTFYENRYANTAMRILDARIPLDGTFGLNVSPVSGLELGVFTGYRWIKDEHFYDFSLTPCHADAQVFRLGGSFKYIYQSIFDMNLNFAYNHWTLQEPVISLTTDGVNFETKTALQKPAFVSNISLGTQIPSIPLRMDLAYHLESGRKTLYEYTVVSNMTDIHDLNFKATYAINDTFSIFAQLNNLLFQKYDIWDGYPAQKFNIMGGISIKF